MDVHNESSSPDKYGSCQPIYIYIFLIMALLNYNNRFYSGAKTEDQCIIVSSDLPKDQCIIVSSASSDNR